MTLVGLRSCAVLSATFLAHLPLAHAAGVEWGSGTHTVESADFNGDNRDDLLVIARDAWRKSGIILADASGQPGKVHQVWRSDHLGIDWSANRLVPLTGSFSRGKCTAGHMGTSCTYPEDLFLQGRDGGVHFVLFTDHGSSTLDAVQQQFADGHLGLDWSSGKHEMLAAHLNSDNYHDVILQAATPDQSNHVVLSTTLDGFDDPSQPSQSWPSRWAGFDWSVADALIHPGDFNGDGVDDLLVQGRTLPGDPFAPGKYGIVSGERQGGFVPSDGGEPTAWLTWSRRGLGVPDWSPDRYRLLVGNFNNDRHDDVLLQPVGEGDAYIVYFGSLEDVGSWVVARLQAGAQGVNWAADAGELVVGDFNGDGRAQLLRLPVSGDEAPQVIGVVGTDANQVAELVVKEIALPTLDLGSSPGPILAGTAIGATPGHFAVNDLGMATYRIPIRVPRGVRGMQPGLALEYDSSLGNGLLGMGWKLGGFPGIQRCPAIADPQADGFTDGIDLDDNDRFCLDGQRLVSANNQGEFRTEIESLQRVTAIQATTEGPRSFRVEDRDGLTWALGGDGARLSVAGGSGPVLQYLVRQVVDKYGNSIRYEWHYDAEFLAARPETLSWHDSLGEEVGRLRFRYALRQDIGEGWQTGERVAHPWRLTEIQTFTRTAGGQIAEIPVKAYHLAYAHSSVTGLSHLVELTECEMTAGKCLGSTRFEVQPGERGFLGQAETTSTGQQELPGLLVADVNNNGIPDYIYLRDLGEGEQAWAVRADGLNGKALQKVALATDWDRTIAFPTGYRGILLDYNGDGHADLAQASNDRASSTTVVRVLEGGENGWDVRDTTLKTRDQGFWASGVGADVNGDGLDDLVSAHGPWVEAYISNGSNLGERRIRGAVPGVLADRGATGPAGRVLRPLNFNGDGRTDVLTMTADCEQAPYVGSVCQSYQWVVYSWLDDQVERLDIAHRLPPGDYIRHLQLLDANGDGLTDLLYHHGQRQRWELHVSDATRFRLAWSGATAELPWLSDTDYSAGQLKPGPLQLSEADELSVRFDAVALQDARIVDYNQDGRDDVLLAIPGQQNLQALWWPNGVTSAAALVDTGVAAPAATDRSRLRVLDVGGDGAPDLLWPTSGSGYAVHHGRRSLRGRITAIEDGFGNQSTIVYGTLSDPGVYDGPTEFNGSNEVVRFPYRHAVGSAYVVRESAVSDATGVEMGAVLTRYRYAGAKLHAQGRGFLGFSRVTASNENRGVVTDNHFAQHFPFQGMLTESVLRFSGNAAGPELKTASLPGGRFSYPAVCEQDVMDPVCQAYLNPFQGFVGEDPDYSLISSSQSRLAKIVTATGGHGSSYLPFVRQVTDSQYAVSGASAEAGRLLKRVRTTYDSADSPVDEWGNPTRIVIATEDVTGMNSHRLVIENSWDNRQESWCPGLLLNSVTTRTSPGHPDSVREQRFSHDARCALSRSVTQPDRSSERISREFAYDAVGNRVEESVRAASGAARRTKWIYGPQYQGRFITREVNAAGHAVESDWDSRFGTPIRQTLPFQAGGSPPSEILFRYDDFGRLASQRGPRQGIREERLLQWCESAGCETPAAVSRQVSLLGNGQEFVQEFDALGRVIHAHRLALGNGRIHIDRRFDSLGREYASSRPYADGQDARCYRYREFDALNRRIFEQAPTGAADCRPGEPPAPAQRPSPGGRQELVTHDLAVFGSRAMVVERRYPGEPGTAAYSTIVGYDLMDRPTRVLEAGSGMQASSTYTWFPDGNLASVADPAGAVTGMTYDGLGQLATINDPHSGRRIFVNNSHGDLEWEVDPAGRLTRYEYDGLSRLVKRTQNYNYLDENDPAQIVSEWGFDTAKGAGTGLPAARTGPFQKGDGPGKAGQAVEWRYDEFGQPRHEIYRLTDQGESLKLWVTRSYDAQGRLRELRYPATGLDATDDRPGKDRLSLRYRYDGRGYLSEVTGNEDWVHWQAASIDAAGTYSRFTVDDGKVVVRRERDVATGRPASISARRDGEWLQQDFFRWSGAGDLVYREDRVSRKEIVFDYDALGRLGLAEIEQAGVPTSRSALVYDPAGNLQNDLQAGIDYRYDSDRPHALKEVDSPTGEIIAYGYDIYGNVIEKGAERYTWTTGNRLAAIRHGAWSHSFEYGADGQVYRQVYEGQGPTRRSVRAGADFEIEFVGDEPPVFHHRLRVAGEAFAVVSGGSSAATETTYLFRDALGSVVGTLQPQGWQNVVYGLWGGRQSDLPDPFSAPDQQLGDSDGNSLRNGFTGHEHLPGSALLHLGGRVLDTATGRFLSPDPVTQFPFSPLGLNRYAYALNRPATFVDPRGLSVGDWLRDVGEKLFFGAPVFFLAGGAPGLETGRLAIGGLSLSLSVTGFRHQAGRASRPVTTASGPGFAGGVGIGPPQGLAMSFDGAETVVRESSAALTNLRVQAGLRGLHHAAGASSADGGAVGARPNTIGEIANRVNQMIGPRANSESRRRPGRVYLVGHPVNGGGPIHSAIEYRDEYGVFWISAGPEGWSAEGFQFLVGGVGSYVNGVRPTDAPENNSALAEVQPPPGLSAKEYFERLSAGADSYCNCADYDLFPSLGDGYNSNSYAIGLIEATGGNPAYDTSGLVGGSKPLPPAYFGY